MPYGKPINTNGKRFMLTRTIFLTLKFLLSHYTIPDNQLEICAKEIVKVLPKRHRERLIPDTRNVIPPLLEDVVSYCKERSRGVDPNKLFNHYTANGWTRGKTKIVDWQAAVRTWEKEDNTNGTQPVDTGRGSNPFGPIKRIIVQTKDGPKYRTDEGGLADCDAPERAGG